MKIKTSFVTASILWDQCNVSDALVAQIDGLHIKADTVYLTVDQSEIKSAAVALKEFMDSSAGYHRETFSSALREIEHYAGHSA